jgi:hypothetical protein
MLAGEECPLLTLLSSTLGVSLVLAVDAGADAQRRCTRFSFLSIYLALKNLVQELLASVLASDMPQPQQEQLFETSSCDHGAECSSNDSTLVSEKSLLCLFLKPFSTWSARWDGAECTVTNSDDIGSWVKAES